MHTALAEFYQLLEEQKPSCEVARHVATQAADAFLKQFQTSGTYLGEAITLLCELATLENPSLARIGVHGLFPLVIERLGDAFTPAACTIYNRLFAQVIDHCRRRPEGKALDQRLRDFGLLTQADVLARASRVREFKHFDRRQTAQVKKAFVLSRVTLGADIAVTSVALACLKQVLPTAGITLVANTKALELFAGDPRIRLCPIEYPRGGGLVERLASWERTAEALQRETDGLSPAEYIVIDPDSRLTQLGLLPLVPDDRAYFFFESRSYQAEGLGAIGALTSHWLQQTFGVTEPFYPYCAPAQSDTTAVADILGPADRRPVRPVVSVNLGVGANPAKRLPDPFEFRLLRRILGAGAAVILDQGGDVEEARRIAQLIAALQEEGFRTLALDRIGENTSRPSKLAGAQLLTWHGGIGRLAALIARSDVYIGYDSAGQHIAAALAVPTIDLFTGFTSPRMPERWAPHGRGPIQVLIFDAPDTYTPTRLETIIDQVLALIPWG
jgi:ADP-heptose:LPS heptosyltransferase